MNGKSQSSQRYVLGHSGEELWRLQKQAELWHPATHRFLEDVGIKVGMKVLDVGTGAGDVALLLADRVGPDGQVMGVDSNPAVLDFARRRAEAAAFTNVSFVQADITHMEFAMDFDAIVGRFILLHLREPVAVLGRLVRSLRPEGSIGFLFYLRLTHCNRTSFTLLPGLLRSAQQAGNPDGVGNNFPANWESVS